MALHSELKYPVPAAAQTTTVTPAAHPATLFYVPSLQNRIVDELLEKAGSAQNLLKNIEQQSEPLKNLFRLRLVQRVCNKLDASRLQLVQHVCKLAVQDKKAEMKAILEIDPSLMFEELELKDAVSDHLGRKSPGSAFRITLATQGVRMLTEVMEPLIPRVENGAQIKREQYDKQFPADEKYKSFDFDPLIKALEVDDCKDYKPNANTEAELQKFRDHFKPKGCEICLMTPEILFREEKREPNKLYIRFELYVEQPESSVSSLKQEYPRENGRLTYITSGMKTTAEIKISELNSTPAAEAIKLNRQILRIATPSDTLAEAQEDRVLREQILRIAAANGHVLPEGLRVISQGNHCDLEMLATFAKIYDEKYMPWSFEKLTVFCRGVLSRLQVELPACRLLELQRGLVYVYDKDQPVVVDDGDVRLDYGSLGKLGEGVFIDIHAFALTWGGAGAPGGAAGRPLIQSYVKQIQSGVRQFMLRDHIEQPSSRCVLM